MHFKVTSAICVNLDQSKILLSGNGLKLWIVCKWVKETHVSHILLSSASRLSFWHIVYQLKKFNLFQIDFLADDKLNVF